MAFIAGSFAALLLFLALMDDTLLERHLYGRNLVWSATATSLPNDYMAFTAPHPDICRLADLTWRLGRDVAVS